MNLYLNAQETESAAKALLDMGHYRQSIYLFCMAIELYLKSKLHLVDHDIDLEASHNVIGLYTVLTKRFHPETDMMPIIKKCRKYFNESRYPYAGDISTYTKEFAEEFMDITAKVKEFIDNDCMATMDDLLNKYSNR